MHITHAKDKPVLYSEDVVNAEAAADGQLRQAGAIYKYFASVCINHSLFLCCCVFYALV